MNFRTYREANQTASKTFNMSQNKKTSKKKVVVTKSKATPTTARRTPAGAPPAEELIFDNSNYMWMGIGAAVVLLGMLLMIGGGMPSPDVWDEDIIYSFRITVLAPVIILIGLGIEIYAIFKK